jgi:hypothetical protein
VTKALDAHRAVRGSVMRWLKRSTTVRIFVTLPLAAQRFNQTQ